MERETNCAGFVKSRILGFEDKYANPQDLLDISEVTLPEEAQFVVFLDKGEKVIHAALYNHKNPKTLIQRDSSGGDVSIRFYDKPVGEIQLDPCQKIQFRRFRPNLTI